MSPTKPTSPTTSGWLIAPQPHLGVGGLVVMLILSNALIPFSLDIYTPSVPELPAYFGTSETMVNLTIMGFFLFFAVGLLIFGPISDRFGRKPVLVLGFALYAAGSALCALSPTIYVLIGARIVQALGAGAVSASSTALLKDCFVRERRGLMLTIIQVLAVVGPVIAPLLGGFIILVAPWQAIFWVLTALGVLCLVASLLFRESLAPEDRLDTGVIQSLTGLGRIARQKKFMMVLTVAGAFALPFMAYIEVGSYIYIDFFGESQQVYTYFFAATAALSSLGPVLYLKIQKSVSPWRFTYILLVLGILTGLGLVALGASSVWVFALFMVVFATLEATVRPYTTNLLLDMAQKDVGSASSMINFLNTAMGVVGMAVIMLPFPNYILGLGIVTAVTMLVSTPLWWRATEMR